MTAQNNATKTTPKSEEKQEIQLASVRFVAEVQRQFVAELGDSLKFTDYEKTLAQHMYVKVDAALMEAESNRTDQNKPAIEWKNVNLQKLALDSVHRIGLGLDALIPNHVHAIPYLNSRTQKYDLDLRIGYMGKDYCRRKMASEEPIDVIYQLVHEHDVFEPLMRSAKNEFESYNFEIQQPFNRGKVLGGFGYIMYKDPKKNKLVLVTANDFEKARKASATDKFWGHDKWEEEMMYKTLVHRVSDKLPLDPTKVNSKSYAYVEEQEADNRIEREIDANANIQTIDVNATVHQGESKSTETPNNQNQSTQSGGPGF